MVGPFSILEAVKSSALNVRMAIEAKWFTMVETKTLFAGYQTNRGRALDPRIIEDIQNRTAGYRHIVPPAQIVLADVTYSLVIQD